MLLLKTLTYFLTMCLISSILNILMLLVLLELLSWIFATMIPTASLKYVIIQSYFVFMMLLFILMMPDNVWVSFLLKTGVPPFHLWFFFISSLITVKMFLFFSTLHKLLPLIFLSKSLLTSSIYMLLYFFGSVLLFQITLFFYVLFCSSVLQSIWLLISGAMSMFLMMAYFVIYLVLMIPLGLSPKVSKISHLSKTQSSFSSIQWLILSGIPPMTFFWLKSTVVLLVTSSFSVMLASLLSSLTVMALASYFRVYHLSLNSNELSTFSLLPTTCILSIMMIY